VLKKATTTTINHGFTTTVIYQGFTDVP